MDLSASRAGRTAAFLLLAASVTGAGQGTYEPMPLEPKDAELVAKSEEIADLLRRRGRVIEEGPGAELVERVGRAVAPAPPSDGYVRFRFGLLRNPVPNAFAMANGQIFVHDGLLALLENEAQLASVLAHECMHVEGHHPLVHARQARQKSGGLLAMRLLIGVAAPEIGYWAAMLTDQLVSTLVVQAIIGYGRDLEEESDRRAVLRLLEAGYDPREMPRTFELLAQDPEGERPDPRPMWSSHPLAVQRTAYVGEMLDELGGAIAAAEERHGGLRVGEDEFEAVVRDAAHRSVQEYLDADRPRMGHWLAERNVARWPGEARFHAQLGDAWRLLDVREPELPRDALTPAAKKRAARERATSTRDERREQRLRDASARERLLANLVRAEHAYSSALRLESDHAAALSGMGHLEEARGDDLAAGRWFARYLRTAGDAPDRAIVARHLEEITQRLRAAAGDGT